MDNFYLSDYRGIADSGAIKLAAGESKRLENIPCKFVKLARWNVPNDESFTESVSRYDDNNETIYYGFSGKIFGQLFAGDSTELIPVSNCDQIIVRSPIVDAVVFYAWFI